MLFINRNVTERILDLKSIFYIFNIRKIKFLGSINHKQEDHGPQCSLEKSGLKTIRWQIPTWAYCCRGSGGNLGYQIDAVEN